eukprot:6202419-Pleurochrysis_carterae.AAC.5
MAWHGNNSSTEDVGLRWHVRDAENQKPCCPRGSAMGKSFIDIGRLTSRLTRIVRKFHRIRKRSRTDPKNV